MSENTVAEQVGHALAEARWEERVTQQQLSDRTGIAQADISRLELGRANPTVKTLARIAEGLGRELYIGFVPPQTEEDS